MRARRTDKSGTAEGDRTGERRTEWRRRRLRRAGFDAALAATVAAEGAIDLHALIELVERGCPPRLAVRILAPLEGDERPC